MTKETILVTGLKPDTRYVVNFAELTEADVWHTRDDKAGVLHFTVTTAQFEPRPPLLTLVEQLTIQENCMRIVELKVKVKSLAAEAKIIRREENKRKAFLDSPRGHSELAAHVRGEFERLKLHRRIPLRREARHALLAYGFLRGRSYYWLERTCHEQPDWKRVEELVRRFGPGRNDLDLKAWREATVAIPERACLPLDSV